MEKTIGFSVVVTLSALLCTPNGSFSANTSNPPAPSQ